MSWSKIRMFVYGFLLGTAGVKVLGSSDAKKVYVKTTAAALRGVDETIKTANNIKENCEDILAEAKELNAKEENEKVIEDHSKKETKKTTKRTRKTK